MKELLAGLLPRLLPASRCTLVAHEGRTDLRQSIPRKLRAWGGPALFVVVHDQDRSDCRKLKRDLQTLCRAAGRPDALVRIVCHELEAWVLGDLAALEQALGVSGVARQQDTRKFRDPDRLAQPATELLGLVPGYRKVSGARTVGSTLGLAGNRSRSFQVFVEGVRKLAARADPESKRSTVTRRGRG